MVRPLLCCALLVLAGCSKPQPPEKERPVEPRAQSELGRAIQAPLDKAKGVEDQVEQGKEAQDAAIQAAGG